MSISIIYFFNYLTFPLFFHYIFPSAVQFTMSYSISKSFHVSFQCCLLHPLFVFLLNRSIYLIYIYKTDCLYLCLSFTSEPPNQFLTNFVQTSTRTLGRFLTNTSLTRPTCHPDPWVPQAPKYKQIAREKTLIYIKYIKFFPGSAGARLSV